MERSTDDFRYPRRRRLRPAFRQADRGRGRHRVRTDFRRYEPAPPRARSSPKPPVRWPDRPQDARSRYHQRRTGPPTGVTVYLSQDLEFVGPVRIGETVTAECEIVEDLGGDRYRLHTPRSSTRTTRRLSTAKPSSSSTNCPTSDASLEGERTSSVDAGRQFRNRNSGRRAI